VIILFEKNLWKTVRVSTPLFNCILPSSSRNNQEKKTGIGKDLGHQLACKNGKGEGRILVPISNI
jgi:hypothetical protein